jgi:hypothetical protein
LLSISMHTLPAVFVIAMVALASASIVGGDGGFSVAPWAWGQRTDNIAQGERQLRQEAFDAIGSLRLAPVPFEDTDRAIANMPLPAPQRQALAADVAPATIAAPAAALAQPPRLRLVSITLWDTDVEDGDVVRVDSEGYSRTLVLTRRGTTIAVPLSANGAIRVTGINDGDGGGITVGLASGAAKVVFPIMSVGQTLQLAATVR